MEPRIIKNDDEYRLYLAEVERLVVADPDADTDEGRRLELLAMLVEDYERQQFEINAPDPIEAIVFRMDQEGLRQKDIAPLLGGKNRASEVLSRKRPLTLPMIRALHESLGIPSELLIREPGEEYVSSEEVNEEQVPLELLIKRGWLDAKLTVGDLLRGFESTSAAPIRLRHTAAYGTSARTNRTHVWLWLSRIRQIGDAQSHVHGRFNRDELNADLIRYVMRLSFMEKGPRLAKEFLEERGIAVVIEPHLPKTHLDGAAMLGSSGTPIVGLSLRENRLDNFWFTLAHELVHVWKHLDNDAHRTIVDENIEKHADEDDIEKEANDLAAEILIPRSVWRRSDAFHDPSAATIRALAKDLHISPAIVAGRIRFERKNYALFSKMVGYRKARSQFPEIRWE